MSPVGPTSPGAVVEGSIAAGTDFGGTQTTFDMSHPSGLIAGELMVGVIVRNHGLATTLAVPAGWVKVQQVEPAIGNPHSMLVWKVADDQDVTAGFSTFTDPAGLSNPWAGFLARVSGYDPLNPVGTFGDLTNSDTASPVMTTPAVTTTRDDELILRIASFGSTGAIITAITDPGGHISLGQRLPGTSTSQVAISGVEEIARVTPPGPTGTADFSHNGGGNTRSVQWTVAIPQALKPTLQSFTTDDNNAFNANPLTPAKPAGLAEGDLMLAFMQARKGNEVTWTPPSGFTLAATWSNTSGVWTKLYQKFADAGDVAASTFTFTPLESTTGKIAILTRWTGADPTTPVNIESSTPQSPTFPATVTCPTVTPTVDKVVILRIVGIHGTGSLIGAAATPPAGVAEVILHQTGSPSGEIRIGTRNVVLTPPGPTLTADWAYTGGNGTQILNAITLALAPVAAPAGGRGKKFGILLSSALQGWKILGNN